MGVLGLLAGLAIACDGAAGSGPDPDPSRSGSGIAVMAALGDSITAGFASCLAPVPCPRNSWSTGDGTRVDSHYRRLRKTDPGLRGRNHAAGNARADALAGQAREAVRDGARYVTVLIGANDACRGRIEDMTPTETFRRQIDEGLAVLKPTAARVLVVSLPDIYRVWEIAHTSQVAVKAWSLGACPALLANPTSTARADEDRRRAFADRVDEYNAQLAAACKAYGPRCRSDGGAAHRVAFGVDMLAAQDFFHPNGSGQNALAKATFAGEPTW
ncbi:GDSL-type esterase/lipase family protein [Dactylosporangium sucinum]|uniref:Lipoprotein n=1 Tax=Dactylosporangium sucinum TaxID=1424081 RepID=A0A917T354_9ACTN|nr:GDSL-type esterase/lipase family protein [Dactylosporangium sucinum]GGM07622.1 lipoprotein [Dactylosporangium sucinum]